MNEEAQSIKNKNVYHIENANANENYNNDNFIFFISNSKFRKIKSKNQYVAQHLISIYSNELSIFVSGGRIVFRRSGGVECKRKGKRSNFLPFMKSHLAHISIAVEVNL